jgi:transcriptional regulator with XRE-family HTH domain
MSYRQRSVVESATKCCVYAASVRQWSQLNGAPNGMNPEQAKELGRKLRARRDELGLSVRDLERLTDVDNGTIVRIEQGAFAAPAPDKLSRIAEALNLSLADVFALAEYSAPSELPSFSPYLRSKYRDLPAPAVEELERSFRRIAKRHGVDPAGPAPGEDEQPEPKPTKPKKGGDHGKQATQSSNRRHA